MANHALLEPGPEPAGTLADIAAPTLVIHGTADPMFPLAHGEALAREIPDATLFPWTALVTNCRHPRPGTSLCTRCSSTHQARVGGVGGADPGPRHGRTNRLVREVLRGRCSNVRICRCS